jgi:hypothetical protein
MLALEVKDFIAKNAPVSLTQLVAEFKLDPQNMQMLLNLLISNHQVSRHSFASPCCGDGKKCGNCVIDSLELYDITDSA